MRRLLIISLAVLFVAGAVIMLVPMLIPAEVYKSEIAKAVEKATGRSFNIAGAVKLEVLPKVHASLEKASLANAQKGQQTPASRHAGPRCSRPSHSFVARDAARRMP
jgi:uncharacterized protein involved in outer membrane biogenesis